MALTGTIDESYFKKLAELEHLHPYSVHGKTAMSLTEKVKTVYKKDGLRGVLSKISARLSKRLRSTPDTPDNIVFLTNDSEDTYFKHELYCSTERIAVYTALFGPYDSITEPLISPNNIDYFVITDQPVPADSVWKVIDPSSCIPVALISDPVMANRWAKMHPHEIFPDYGSSVYIDASILILSDLTPLTASLIYYPIAMFRHKSRTCVYQEIEACRHQNKAPEDLLLKHLSILRSNGVPENWGLLEAPVVSRRHNDPVCISIMNKWWEYFVTSPSKRDQIALIDCLWQLSIPPEKLVRLPGTVSQCRIFRINKHWIHDHE